MRFVRFADNDDQIHVGSMLDASTAELLDGSLEAGFRPTGQIKSIQRLLCPLAPTAILGIGLNYRFHAEESDAKVPEHPILFVKTPNTVIGPDDPVLIPTSLPSHEVDYECELAVVIGTTCKNVSAEKALDVVFGYTCANDVSARDWQIQRGGGQWCRGKSFDTFCPLGPWITTADEIPDPNQLRIKTVLNGHTVQDWNTRDMIFGVRDLVAFLSGSTTLYAGTVILTGTPHGVGMARRPPLWLKPDDIVTVTIEGIGSLSNPVRLESSTGS